MVAEILWSVDHVQVAAPAGCEPAARAFFGGVLGLPEIPKPENMRARGGCWFRSANIEIHVGVTANFQPAKKAHIGLAVGELAALEALAERLVQGAHPVRWDTRLPGYRRFFTEDPWGNRLELLACLPETG